MAKTYEAQGEAGVVILCVLGLVCVCGVYEIDITDLLEIMANFSLYECITHSYIMSLLGMDANKIYQFRYQLPNGQTVGSRLNNMAISGMLDLSGLIQLGTVKSGQAVLTYPCPVEELKDIQIKVKSEAKSAQDEPIFMDSVLVMILSYHPANKHKRTAMRLYTVDIL